MGTLFSESELEEVVGMRLPAGYEQLRKRTAELALGPVREKRQIGITMDARHENKLNRYARRHGLNRSAAIAQILDQYL